MFVNEFFHLNEEACEIITGMKPQFGFDGLGEFLFYRTYSRKKRNGKKETWAECVIRVINGTFSIRKDWYTKNHIPWVEEYWQQYALEMAISMFNMEWVPPGRGLWMMGAQFMYERGSMALYNCAFTKLTSDNFADDIYWLMDCLMLGVGVGFEPTEDPMPVKEPIGSYRHLITDDREGWALSDKLIIQAFTVPGTRMPIMDYGIIRPAGLPIAGFGGISSGPESLKRHHEFIISCFRRHIADPNGYPVFRLKADIANHNGVCVVAGNVRRSAELMEGEVTNELFLNLKDYEIYPDREAYGWMSNNTAKFYRDEHFEMLGEIAKRVIVRGEPGVANLKNFPFGRIGKKDRTRYDNATGLNPCGEITLEHRETCNVVETCPTRCANVERWYKACEFATVYASSVSLLPTHQPSTNRVVARNRRIGVGIIDYTGWRIHESQHRLIKYMRKGYEIVTKTNRTLNAEAGVPEAIKKTTIKPGGTVPKLVGRTSGIGYPTFGPTIRRVRLQNNSTEAGILKAAGFQHEPLKHEPDKTTVISWPIRQGPAKPAQEVTLWEQALNLVTVQSEWADNAVSNTLYFRPKWKCVKAHMAKYTQLSPEHTVVEGISVDKIVMKHPSINAAFLNKQKEVIIDNFRLTMKWENDLCVSAFEFVFDPTHEENDIEPVLSSVVPRIKSLSLCPHMSPAIYDQAPEEGITEQQYQELKKGLREIDWSVLTNDDGILVESQDAVGDKYCDGPQCELPINQEGTKTI